MKEATNAQVTPAEKTNLKRRLSKIKRRLLARHIWFVRLSLAAILMMAVVLMVMMVRFVFNSTQLGTYASLANNFLFTPEENIDTYRGFTNVLILGKAGAGHTAPDLTDTMMLASVSTSGDKIQLISIPRDIWIEDMRAKINSAYYWGNERQPGGGLVLARSSVEEVVGVPVHYALVVDFSGFVEVIDILGGVEIDVKHGFIDKRFPIPGRENDECGDLVEQEGEPEFPCRYETLVFEEGKQLMDGETALKYSRSRQSEDEDEGTDLARSRRQQQVLSAIQSKVLSREILLSPGKLSRLGDAANKHIETDIPPEAGAILARRIMQSKDSVDSAVIPEDYLENPPLVPEYDNLYVFIPKSEDWSEVHAWVEGLLEL